MRMTSSSMRGSAARIAVALSFERAVAPVAASITACSARRPSSSFGDATVASRDAARVNSPREISSGTSTSTTYGRSSSDTFSSARRSADSARCTSPSHCQMVADNSNPAVLVRSYRASIA